MYVQHDAADHGDRAWAGRQLEGQGTQGQTVFRCTRYQDCHKQLSLSPGSRADNGDAGCFGAEYPSDACKIEIHATGFGERRAEGRYFGPAPSRHISRKYLAMPLSQLLFMWEAGGCRLIDCCWQMNVIQIPLCLALCLGRSLVSFQPCHPTLPRLASPSGPTTCLSIQSSASEPRSPPLTPTTPDRDLGPACRPRSAAQLQPVPSTP